MAHAHEQDLVQRSAAKARLAKRIFLQPVPPVPGVCGPSLLGVPVLPAGLDDPLVQSWLRGTSHRKIASAHYHAALSRGDPSDSGRSEEGVQNHAHLGHLAPLEGAKHLRF